MKAAIVVTFGSVRPGREKNALDLWANGLTYLDGEQKAGNITGYRALGAGTGGGGTGQIMQIIEGDLDSLLKVWQSEEFSRNIAFPANLVCEDFSLNIYSDLVDDPSTLGVFAEVLEKVTN